MYERSLEEIAKRVYPGGGSSYVRWTSPTYYTQKETGLVKKFIWVNVYTEKGAASLTHNERTFGEWAHIKKTTVRKKVPRGKFL